MQEHEVVIAGGGPTGLMLAAELALAGTDVVIVERRRSRGLEGSRAGGLHSRSIEILDQRGIAERFLAEGKPAQVAGFAGVVLDISDFPTRHPYGLALWQKHIERLLGDWVDELKVPVLRGLEVSGFRQDETGIDIEIDGGQRLRARYLVGCDGGRSAVRKQAGIAFEGWDATVSHLIAEVRLAEEPEWGMRTDAIGLHGLSRLDDAGVVRAMVSERQTGATDEPTLGDLSAALIAHYGTDFGVHSPIWISRFTDAARQAASYRAGRVLIAGDAAHVHYPAGGQGLNIGLQDAVNLGWKLAQVVSGVSPASLLDTYESERHPIAARVLRDTLASVAAGRTDERSKALREMVAGMLALDEPRKVTAGRMSGLDICYDPGRAHPLVGRRMPDLDIVIPEGNSRVFALLRAARPVVLNFGGALDFDFEAWSERLRFLDARYSGEWVLPVIGKVAAPSAVAIRPDGYVAWVGDGTAHGLAEILAKWFGDGGEGMARPRGVEPLSAP